MSLINKMNSRKHPIHLTLLFCGLYLNASCFGAEHLDHELSVAAGIASPSETSSVFQNPAGLVFENKTAVSLMTAFPTNSLTYPILEGGIYTGNGNLGASLGIEKPTVAGNSSSLYYGFGFLIPNISSSFGISGTTSFNGGSAFNLGALFGTFEKFRVGATVRDFTSSGREWGIGMNYDFSTDASFVLDASLDNSFGNPWLEPALVLRASSAAFTLGYGFAVTSGNSYYSSQIADGFAAGLSIKFSQNLNFQAYYQQLSHYLFELTILF